jgi:hypothetical protein
MPGGNHFEPQDKPMGHLDPPIYTPSPPAQNMSPNSDAFADIEAENEHFVQTLDYPISIEVVRNDPNSIEELEIWAIKAMKENRLLRKSLIRAQQTNKHLQEVIARKNQTISRLLPLAQMFVEQNSLESFFTGIVSTKEIRRSRSTSAGPATRQYSVDTAETTINNLRPII